MIWLDYLDDALHDQLYEIYKNEWWTRGRNKEDVIKIIAAKG